MVSIPRNKTKFRRFEFVCDHHNLRWTMDSSKIEVEPEESTLGDSKTLDRDAICGECGDKDDVLKGDYRCEYCKARERFLQTYHDAPEEAWPCSTATPAA